MASLNEPLVLDTLTVGKTINLPEKAVPASKVIHQFAVHYAQAGGSDVVVATFPIHTCYKDGTLVAVEVTPLVAPTGGDKAFTVDVQKGNQAGAFATVLSSVVTINNTKADRQVVAGSLSTTALADGDTLEVVIAVSGTTGSQGQGALITVTIQENPVT